MTVYEKIREALQTGRPNQRPNSAEEQGCYTLVRRAMDPAYDAYCAGLETPNERVERLSTKRALPHLKELLHTDDARALIRRVVQDILVEPTEPQCIGQDVLFPKLRVENTGSTIELILTDAIVAQLVNEGEALRSTNLDVTKARHEVKIISSGVQIAITQRMVQESSYDIVGMHYRAAAAALRRYKEEYIWKLVLQAAYTIFNNTDTTLAYKGATTGVGSAGTANNTLTQLDFVDLLAGIVNHGLNPTDWIFHPLAWSGLAKDPLLRVLLDLGWPTNQPILMPESALKVPYSLQVHMVPFINNNAATKAASAAITTDMLVLDRNESAVLIQQQEPEPTQWEDMATDVLMAKWVERWGVAIKRAGAGITAAKGVVADANYGPIPLTKAVS